MICGLGLFALPIAIVATGFAQEIHRREFVVSWSMVARVPLFEGMTPAELLEVARRLHSETYAAGVIVAREGEPARGLYILAGGRAELRYSDGRRHELVEGAHTGETALLRHTSRLGTLTTLTRCRMLILESSDFHALLVKHPSLKARLDRIASGYVAAGLEPDRDG